MTFEQLFYKSILRLEIFSSKKTSKKSFFNQIWLNFVAPYPKYKLYSKNHIQTDSILYEKQKWKHSRLYWWLKLFLTQQ